MILRGRILLWWLLTLYLSPDFATADCYWRVDGNKNYYTNIPCWIKPVLDCKSTVTHDIRNCQEKSGTETGIYNIIVNLKNPDEKPFNMANVTFYKEVNIQDGHLVTIPTKIFAMTNLTDLKISYNKLRKVNFNDFSPLANLKKLDLSKNNINLIGNATNGNSSTSSVQIIDVSFNIIDIVPNNFMMKFKELQHLNMSNNIISTIGKLAFEGTVQLKTLDLSHNKLHNVDNIFVQLPKLYDQNYGSKELNFQKLTTLILDYNYITNINFAEFFETGIPELHIGNNLIPCKTLANIKYSQHSEKFNRYITATNLTFHPGYINGISCQETHTEKDILIVSENPNANSSFLITQLKKAIENNSKSVDSLIKIVAQNEEKIEHFMERTNLTLTSINKNQMNSKKILEKLDGFVDKSHDKEPELKSDMKEEPVNFGVNN